MGALDDLTMTERLVNEILACPEDGQALRQADHVFRCTVCDKRYPASDGEIRFLTDDTERPMPCLNLARLPEINGVELYERNAAHNRCRDRAHPAMFEALKAVAAHGDVIVDLATGPGGGFVASLLDLVDDSTLVLGTDACRPVVENQARLFRRERSDDFWMVDVDLGRRLPFRNGVIDCFTGRAITNIDAVDAALKELGRCLTSDGLVLLQEHFYAQGSETARHLSRAGHPFASMVSFKSYAHSVGFTILSHADIVRRRGKSDPRDGLPLSEDDEWTSTLLTMARSEYRSPQGG